MRLVKLWFVTSYAQLHSIVQDGVDEIMAIQLAKAAITNMESVSAIQANTARDGSEEQSSTSPNGTNVPKLQLPQTQELFRDLAWEFPREGLASNRQYQQYAYTENEVTRLASFVKQLPLSFPDDKVDEEFLRYLFTICPPMPSHPTLPGTLKNDEVTII